MTPQLTLTQFTVDLGDFEDAIAKIQGAATAIEDDVTQINQKCATLALEWAGPAGTTFGALAVNTQTAMGKMTGLLDEMLSRMRLSAQNYREIEQANTKNVS